MLKSADFSNFTTVPNDRWTFSPKINVIVGENGLGKSHVLKAIYAVMKAQMGPPVNKAQMEKRIADELLETMRPDSLGRLVKRQPGRGRAEISLSFKGRDAKVSFKDAKVSFKFATNSRSQVDLMTPFSDPLRHLRPVFIPTRELMTLCPWFVSLYDNQYLPFEKIWRDTVSLLGMPTLRGPRERKAKTLLDPIENAMGGKVEVDKTGRLYLRTRKGNVEAALVAEGLRKFAVLARLVSTGALLEKGYLFWDEPESNLNPKLIKILAQIILSLARKGIQVFIATHSLFLLREISILGGSDARYFALAASDDGDTRLEQGESVEDLQTLVLLDEELDQSDRFMKKFNHG